MPSSSEHLAGGLAQLIEPEALLRHAQAHPPRGFHPLPGQAPAFSAPLDLLTTAEPALRRRLRGWPGHRWWGRWLRWPAAFIGSTVTEYMPLPVGVNLEGLPAQWQALGRGRRLVVAKDLPQRSPFLSDADNARADALAEACRRAGWILLEGQALAYVPMDFGDIHGYLARLSKARQKDLRRKLRSRDALVVQCLPTGSACFDDEGLVDQYHALYRQVYEQSELHFDEFGRDYFASVLRDGDASGLVFEYRLRDTGLLIGWNLCFEHGGLLIDKTLGLRYPEARTANLYFVSWFVNLEHALARGCTHYVAGWTDPEVKARLGARFTFTRHAVWVCNPLLRRLAAPLAPWFEGDARTLEVRT